MRAGALVVLSLMSSDVEDAFFLERMSFGRKQGADPKSDEAPERMY
jgi:hypothetical protein